MESEQNPQFETPRIGLLFEVRLLTGPAKPAWDLLKLHSTSLKHAIGTLDRAGPSQEDWHRSAFGKAKDDVCYGLEKLEKSLLAFNACWDSLLVEEAGQEYNPRTQDPEQIHYLKRLAGFKLRNKVAADAKKDRTQTALLVFQAKRHLQLDQKAEKIASDASLEFSSNPSAPGYRWKLSYGENNQHRLCKHNKGRRRTRDNGASRLCANGENRQGKCGIASQLG